MDKQKAEILRAVLDRLPVHEIGVSRALGRKIERIASKTTGRLDIFRREPFEEAFLEEPAAIAEHLEQRGLTAANTQAINRCHIARGPAYSIQLLCSRFPNGETGFSIFFVDEDVTVDISESEARLLHRFMNDDRFDVLDCFEKKSVQELLRRAERQALERRFRDVSHEDEWQEVDA